MNHRPSISKKYYPVIGAALLAASLFQFSLPAFAAGTEAGLDLKNRATATYDDGTTNYEVISNEVTVTVGKVAGLTNVPDGFVDNTGGTPVLPGDSLSFDFKVTNTGNDVTNIFIPSPSTINTTAVNFTVPDTIGPNSSVRYRLETDPDVPASYTDVPANGIIEDIAEDVSIIVRVTGTVDAGANINDTVSVRLGDTGNNNNDPDTQNQLDVDPGITTSDPQASDVRTLTGSNPTVPGEPVNKQREAAALNAITVGSNPLALTKISKTASSPVNDSGTPDDITDDVITYNLALDVLPQKLNRYNNFNFNPAALEGRDYNTAGTGSFSNNSIAFGNAAQSNLILISDAVPVDTVINKATIGTTVTSPNNWTPVYTDDDLTVSPDEAAWDTDATAVAGAITRIGWIYDARATTDGNDVIAPSAVSITGFSFPVAIDGGVTNTATSIYNIAQVFGSTDDGDDNATGGAVTFDESGDENPNNFNDDGTAGPLETVGFDNGVDTVFGFADPGTNEDNVDTNGDNTATGSAGGEVNKVALTPGLAAQDLLNGPLNLPQAEGNVFGQGPDSNHDFQNAAGEVPAATVQVTQDTDGDGNTVTTAATVIEFENTVQNTETGPIDDVVLQPIAPSALGLGGTDADLPDGTTVQIRYGAVGAPDTQIVNYSYTAAGGFTTTDDPVIIPTILGTSAGAGNNNENYVVTLTLPIGTELSTNNGVGAYPVPIAAYADSDTNAADDAGTSSTPILPAPVANYPVANGNGLNEEDTYNVTVNQAYLGYLKLVKKARVLRDADANGVYDGIFDPEPGMGFNDPDADKSAAPGDIIEYQVEYSNISEPQGSGSGNVTLDAENVEIDENGTAGDNNWGIDGADADSVIDTLHVPSVIGSTSSNTGTASYFSGANGTTASNDANREVTRYLYDAGNVVPGDSGTFTFQRKVTDESDVEDLTTP